MSTIKSANAYQKDLDRLFETDASRISVNTTTKSDYTASASSYEAGSQRVERVNITRDRCQEEKDRFQQQYEARKGMKVSVDALRQEILDFGAEKLPRLAKLGATSLGPVKLTFIGPKNSGKTALIHLIERALFNTTGITSARPGLPTRHITYHRLSKRKAIVVVDTPGVQPAESKFSDPKDLLKNPNDETKLLINILQGDIAEGQEVVDHAGKEKTIATPKNEKGSFDTLWKGTHVVIFVFSVRDFNSSDKRYETIKAYASLRQFLRWDGIQCICVVTHEHLLDPSARRRDAARPPPNTHRRREAFPSREDIMRCARTASGADDKEDSVFFIECCEPYMPGDESQRYPLARRYEMEKIALLIVRTALHKSQETIVLKFDRSRKNAVKEAAAAVGEVDEQEQDDSVSLETQDGNVNLRKFLWQQNRSQRWHYDADINDVAESFAKEDINNFEGLRCCWSAQFCKDTVAKLPPPVRAVIRIGMGPSYAEK